MRLIFKMCKENFLLFKENFLLFYRNVYLFLMVFKKVDGCFLKHHVV